MAWQEVELKVPPLPDLLKDEEHFQLLLQVCIHHLSEFSWNLVFDIFSCKWIMSTWTEIVWNKLLDQ